MTEHRALCGWLLKQDAKSLWRGWKRRWFQQLHDYQLYYFTSCTTDITLSKGFIDMKTIVNIQTDSKDKHVFHVMTPDRTYILQASTEDEVNYWTAGFNAIVANLSQPLSELIAKAEAMEKQRNRSSVNLTGPNKTQPVRPISMRITEGETPSQEITNAKEKSMTRSSSAQNIVYIDYGLQTPLASTASVPNFATIKPERVEAPPSPSLASTSFPNLLLAASQERRVSAEETKSTPILDLFKSNDRRSNDLQALIVREKDAEIARLTMEVVRLNGLHNQTTEIARQERQQLRAEENQRYADMERRRENQKQTDLNRIEEHSRFANMERRLTEQIDELTLALRKREAEYTHAQHAMGTAMEESERARAELAQIRQETEQKITILESEIKLKENIIVQLNSTITSLNGELSAKDSLLENSMREITYPNAFDDMLTVAQLEKERETRHALQEQCAFLGQEVFKLETELKQARVLISEQKNKILERSSAAGPSGPNATFLSSSPAPRSYFDFAAATAMNGNGAMSSAVFLQDPESQQQIKFLKIENDDLRQKYFMSVGRSLKLQMTMNGGFSNVSIVDLFDQARQKGIRIEEWPNWISNNLADSLQAPNSA